MPLRVLGEQTVMVGHRSSFWGAPSGPSTVSWDYEGGLWTVRRPPDGAEPAERQTRCCECRELLSYQVHSVESTYARQRRWRQLSWFGLALFLVGGVVLFGVVLPQDDPSAVLAVLAFLVFTGGAVLGWTSGLQASSELGIVGNGESLPIVGKHAIVSKDGEEESRS